MKVLLFDPDRHLMDGLPGGVVVSIQSTEEALRKVLGDKVEIKLVRDFEFFRDMVRSEIWDVIATDAMKEDEVASIIIGAKRYNPETIVLVEECEGHEKAIVKAGADEVFHYWAETRGEHSGLLDVLKRIALEKDVATEETKVVASKIIIGGRKMKVLVIDDNPKHQISALETLAGHEVTVAKSFQEAKNLLVVRADHDEVLELMRDGMSHKEAIELCTPEPSDYDVVLSDLLMRGSEEKMGPKGHRFLNQEMAFGKTIALFAAKAGVPMIMVITDANHHDHPMAYTFDMLNGHGGEFDPEQDIIINNSKLMFRFCQRFTDTSGKNWGYMLGGLGSLDSKI